MAIVELSMHSSDKQVDTCFNQMTKLVSMATVVAGSMLNHMPQQRLLWNPVICIREGTTIDAAGFRWRQSKSGMLGS